MRCDDGLLNIGRANEIRLRPADDVKKRFVAKGKPCFVTVYFDAGAPVEFCDVFYGPEKKAQEFLDDIYDRIVRLEEMDAKGE